MMQGWCKIKQACKYSGVSERTFRKWLRNGLKHSRMPSGTILINFEDIDTFLKKYEVNHNQVDEMVDEVLKGL